MQLQRCTSLFLELLLLGPKDDVLPVRVSDKERKLIQAASDSVVAGVSDVPVLVGNRVKLRDASKDLDAVKDCRVGIEFVRSVAIRGSDNARNFAEVG